MKDKPNSAQWTAEALLEMPDDSYYSDIPAGIDDLKELARQYRILTAIPEERQPLQWRLPDLPSGVDAWSVSDQTFGACGKCGQPFYLGDLYAEMEGKLCHAVCRIGAQKERKPKRIRITQVSDSWIWYGANGTNIGQEFEVDHEDVVNGHETWVICIDGQAYGIQKRDAEVIEYHKPEPDNWTFERSSGYAGWRCQKCATWIYEHEWQNEAARICRCKPDELSDEQERWWHALPIQLNDLSYVDHKKCPCGEICASAPILGIPRGWIERHWEHRDMNKDEKQIDEKGRPISFWGGLDEKRVSEHWTADIAKPEPILSVLFFLTDKWIWAVPQHIVDEVPFGEIPWFRMIRTGSPYQMAKTTMDEIRSDIHSFVQDLSSGPRTPGIRREMDGNYRMYDADKICIKVFEPYDWMVLSHCVGVEIPVNDPVRYESEWTCLYPGEGAENIPSVKPPEFQVFRLEVTKG